MSIGREEATLAVGREARSLGVVLEVSGTPAHPSRYELSMGSCRIGAGRGADIVVSDDAVSRAHVELTLAPDGVVVQDLGSRNGTFYLGQRVERIVLSLGSRIQIGGTVISILPDQKTFDKEISTELTSYGELVGTSLPMRRLFGILARLEGSLVTVLVQGESGSGKELIARALHQRSLVAKGPFVAVNCGALDRSLARSELFGHTRGAFTGAVTAREGAFEAAIGGTLFLDEIGELPLEVQPLLLRALELGAITRVGENTERPAKVRVIAATNRDLEESVRARTFREDLLYRLRVVKLDVPPLRDADDIELMARHLAQRDDLGVLPPSLISNLRAQSWPGNGRELRNALRAWGALGVLPDLKPVAASDLDVALDDAADPTQPYAEQKEALLQRFLQAYLKKLLAHTSGNQSEASRISGIDRSYLNKLLAKLNPKDSG